MTGRWYCDGPTSLFDQGQISGGRPHRRPRVWEELNRGPIRSMPLSSPGGPCLSHPEHLAPPLGCQLFVSRLPRPRPILRPRVRFAIQQPIRTNRMTTPHNSLLKKSGSGPIFGLAVFFAAGRWPKTWT